MKIIAACLAVVLVCTAALGWARATPSTSLSIKSDTASLQAYGRSVGCKDLQLRETGIFEKTNGYFHIIPRDKDWKDPIPEIVLVHLLTAPPNVRIMLFLHELGHCMQYEKNYAMAAPNSQTLELDADQWSAEFACRMGADGPRLVTDLMDWMYKQYGYDGDPGHGTVVQREAAAMTAPSCLKLH